MKIDGYDVNGPARTTVRLDRPGKPLEIEVEAFPFGFDVAELLPFPQPPATGIRKKNGEVLRDAHGDPLIVRDENDPDYRREKDRVFWLRMAAMFYYAVLPCGKVKFETSGDPKENPQAFFAKVADEIEASWIASADVDRVIEAVRELSAFNRTEAEAAERSFFPAASCLREG